MEKLGTYIEKYIALRDRKKEIEERHKEELAPINLAMKKLEDVFQQQMDKHGLETLNSEHGTAYKSVLVSTKLVDRIAFLEYVRCHDAWHLVDARPSRTAVGEFTEETGVAPPGVNVERIAKINVRRK